MQRTFQFIKSNGPLFCASLAFSYICFAFKLMQPTLGIDEEFWVDAAASDNLTWLLQNRYSLYLYNLIFTDNGSFVPTFPDILGIFFWVISGFIFLDFFWKLTDEKRFIVKFLTLGLYSSQPLCMAEAFGFSMMIVPETLAMIFVAIAFRFSNKSGILSYLFPILLLVIALGAYQALFGIFLTALFGLCFFKERNRKEVLIKGIGIALASFLLYTIITKIIALNIGENDYLSQNYIGWLDERGIPYALFMSLANVIRISFGITIQNVSVYGGLGICFLSILFISTSISDFLKSKNTKNLLFSAALFISPFMMYICLGTYKTNGRTLLALALLLALEILYIFQKLPNKNCFAAFTTCGILLLVAHTCWINSIYYHQHLLNVQDQATVKSINQFLEERFFNYEKPVVFIGALDYKNMEFKKSGTLGCSFFSYDDGNNYRMRAVFSIWGHPLKEPSPIQVLEAYKLSSALENWPSSKSFKETDQFAIIHFSEPSDKWKSVNLE